MTIKLLVLGALCAFLGSQWYKGSASEGSVASCAASVHNCHGTVLGRASPDQFFAALTMR
ncbi:hypothetical protein LLG90_19670 [Aromatoleum toluclasticum]|uniref:hypothetical protein n=1 Tax=Aromatoleum toluclasticum TaxID=92003 RepID=UPI001D18BFC7|nr:hypothetical protein [Aromatoleum toluclasticum]MCC4117581.1 hypothetical protein [Aromatoleum toluclasticum]